MKTLLAFALSCLAVRAYAWSSDPNTISRVNCHATTTRSDLNVDIVRKGDNLFSANVSQTIPTKIHASFSKVSASWSGHFFNFNAPTNAKGETPFHLLTRGTQGGNQSDRDNLQVDDGNGNALGITTPFECSISTAAR